MWQHHTGQPDSTRWKPMYTDGGERPCFTRHFAEGDIHFYGSGTIEVVMSEVPIILRIHWHRSGRAVRWALDDGKRREAAMALRRVHAAATAAAPGGPGLTDAGEFPTLVEYLTSDKFDDGSPREPSALIIVADRSGWRGCVSDKDNGRTLWKASSSVLELLMALEIALAEDDPSAWRQASSAKRGGKKRG